MFSETDLAVLTATFGLPLFSEPQTVSHFAPQSNFFFSRFLDFLNIPLSATGCINRYSCSKIVPLIASIAVSETKVQNNVLYNGLILVVFT